MEYIFLLLESLLDIGSMMCANVCDVITFLSFFLVRDDLKQNQKKWKQIHDFKGCKNNYKINCPTWYFCLFAYLFLTNWQMKTSKELKM